MTPKASRNMAAERMPALYQGMSINAMELLAAAQYWQSAKWPS